MTEAEQKTLTEGDVIIDPQGRRWCVLYYYAKLAFVVPASPSETHVLGRTELLDYRKEERRGPIDRRRRPADAA